MSIRVLCIASYLLYSLTMSYNNDISVAPGESKTEKASKKVRKRDSSSRF